MGTRRAQKPDLEVPDRFGCTKREDTMISGTLVALDYDRVRNLAAMGNSLRTIAEELGIRWGTFLRRRKEDDLLEEAIQAGRGEEESALVGRLYQTATEGKGKEAITAAIFLLKARHGYREGEPLDRGVTQVGVIVNIPAPLDSEQYKQLVEVHGETISSEPDDVTR